MPILLSLMVPLRTTDGIPQQHYISLKVPVTSLHSSDSIHHSTYCTPPQYWTPSNELPLPPTVLMVSPIEHPSQCLKSSTAQYYTYVP